MQTHRFKVGQALVFTPGRMEGRQTADLFEITRLLPPAGEDLQYRVRHSGTGQERVVRESQLHKP